MRKLSNSTVTMSSWQPDDMRWYPRLPAKPRPSRSKQSPHLNEVAEEMKMIDAGSGARTTYFQSKHVGQGLTSNEAQNQSLGVEKHMPLAPLGRRPGDVAAFFNGLTCSSPGNYHQAREGQERYSTFTTWTDHLHTSSVRRPSRPSALLPPLAHA